MALSVLITQCLQRDFLDPLGPEEPLPNRLHIGPAEARRLLGPDPAAGPVAQLMSWARSQPREALEVIHIRDWHDPEDPRQRDHLATFGAHCVRGSRGAELVLDLDAGAGVRANQRLVDSIALNDFEGTGLAGILAELSARAGPGGLRVGVIGVWTEAKVSFLLYDLKTRLGIDQLATCSALTASASRAGHFQALEQLGSLLGVSCFESVAEFAAWLRPGSALELPAAQRRFGVRVALPAGAPELAEADRDIVGYLYRDSSEVELEPLSGGFSGAMVFRASGRDALGHRQAPSVLKLGPNRIVARERVAFERVEGILGNSAPGVRGFVDLGERAGIKYSYAAMGQGRVRTLKSLFEAGAGGAELDAVLRAVFGEILAPLYAAARWERLPLLEHYGFAPERAGRVRELVAGILGPAGADRDELEFPGGYRAANVVRFYRELRPAGAAAAGEYHYVSYVHGDLNGANVLIDARGNVWVIDFFHTGPGHVLKDLAKLENDLLYLFTPLASPAELAEALAITRALRAVEDLGAELPERLAELRSPGLRRAWDALRTLRGFVARFCRDDRAPRQMTAALLRYAVHTLSFPEASALQKTWALAAACGLAEDLARAPSPGGAGR